LLLDLGMPLDAGGGDPPMPDVPGLSGEDPSLLGIALSHLHLDHCGLVPYAARNLPIAMGAKAARILQEAAFFNGRDLGIEPAWTLEDRRPFSIGPFRITPYAVDHSAFDAYALLIEAAGRRLFYTGDIRGHGNDSTLFAGLLQDPPARVDALLMEGTQIGDGRQHDGPSEADLRWALARRFREWRGLVLVAWSAQNLDRLTTVYRAAGDAGRTLVVDLYQATMAELTGDPAIPVPGSEGLAVYCRQRERVQVKEARQFERVERIRKWRIFAEQIAARGSELVVVLRPSMLRELDRAFALEGALAIWSLWAGYLEGAGEKRMAGLLEARKVPLERHHVSGHAYLTDLQRLTSAIAPFRVVPIHTFAPDRFGEHFADVERHEDGEWWEV
jgi:ribonuclease J